MNRVKGLLKNNSFFLKSLAMLTSGSLIGSLITALQQILQTRIFSDESIGIYTYLLAIPLMFTGITSFRYDISIVVEKSEHKALALVKLSFLLSTVLSIAVTAFCTVYTIVADKDYIPYLYVMPFIFIMLFGYGINNILNSYSNRCQDYKMISVTYVIRTLGQRGGVLLLGIIFVKLFNLSALSIIIMVMCYSFGLYFAIIRQSKLLRCHLSEIKSITWNEMKEVMIENRKQPLYSTPALFVNSFSYSAITIIIEKLYNTVVLAHYSVSNRVLGMPISLVSGNVAKIYIEQAAKEYKDTGKFDKSFKKTFMFLLALAIPMFLVIYFVVPPLCGLIFGKGWEASGDYIRILALMFSFRLIGTALSQSLVVCNRQDVELIINISLGIATVFSGIVAYFMKANVEVFLALICGTRSLCYIGLIICVYIFSKGVKKYD